MSKASEVLDLTMKLEVSEHLRRELGAENAKLREEVIMRQAEARDDRRTIKKLETLLEADDE